MSRITFNDGVSFDTSGRYRAEQRWDGWYMVGGGMLVPCQDRQEAEKLAVLYASQDAQVKR
jgi:hypothetical protein